MQIRCFSVQSPIVRPDPHGRYEVGRVEPGFRRELVGQAAGHVMPALGRFIDDELKHGKLRIYDRDRSDGIWRPVIMNVVEQDAMVISSGEVSRHFDVRTLAELIGRRVMFNDEIVWPLSVGALTWIPGYRRLVLFADTDLDM